MTGVLGKLSVGLAGALGTFTLFATLPTTTNYSLQSYGFGSGGTSNSSTPTYSLEGITGELSGQSSSTSTYTQKPGFIETQQANVPKITLTNSGNTYDKLHFVIDTQSNPTDALYAIQVKVNDATCDFTTGTIRYVQSDDTLSSSLVTADYQTYSAWGSASGQNMIGLSPSTTYCVRARATQGKFTESAYGPSSSAATVGQTISFCLYTNANCAAGGLSESFSLVAGNVATSGNIGVDFATNADSGGSVYIYSSGALTSSTHSGTPINSGAAGTTTDLSSASKGYGAQVASSLSGFPSTPVLDNFNRANSTGLGSNWSLQSGGFVDFDVVSNQAHTHNCCGSSFAWDYWNPGTFGPDSEAFATVASASTDARRVCVRFDPSVRNGYCVSDSSSTWSLIKLVSGSSTTLGSTFTQSVSVGDKIGIRVTGGSPATLEAWYYNSSTSTWSQLFTQTDSTYTSANYISMESRGSDLDDFGGGTYSNSPFNSLSPYNGSANIVGAIGTTATTILSANSPLTGGQAAIQLQAKSDNLTKAASDYTDVVTVIAAATF